MGRNRQTKIIAIVALVVAIVGMSLGFAAFSTTLNISSSATVTPNSDDFSVKFYQSAVSTYAGHEEPLAPDMGGNTNIYWEATNGATATSIVLNSSTTSLSGLNANFTEPGQSVTYIVYAGNTGSYDAYLKSVTFANVSGASSNKVCTPGTDATESLVTAACNSISIKVDIDGTTVTDTDTLSNHILYMNSFEPISITISYVSDGAWADGPFSVSFGDISLEYSTVDNSRKQIFFTVYGEIFQAEEGMTWEDFLTSTYNLNNRFTISTKGVALDGNEFYDSETVMRVNVSEIIKGNGEYI